jgi:hypothetical protein
MGRWLPTCESMRAGISRNAGGRRTQGVAKHSACFVFPVITRARVCATASIFSRRTPQPPPLPPTVEITANFAAILVRQLLSVTSFSFLPSAFPSNLVRCPSCYPTPSKRSLTPSPSPRAHDRHSTPMDSLRGTRKSERNKGKRKEPPQAPNPKPPKRTKSGSKPPEAQASAKQQEHGKIRKGEYYYVRVKDRVDGEDETDENFVIVWIHQTRPLVAWEVLPAPATGPSWVRSSVYLLPVEPGLIPAFTCR